MADRPPIQPGDEISVEGVRAVVSLVREPGDPFHDCEVVICPEKPANRDVAWNGTGWEFAPSPDYGGYAERYPRLAPFVAQLRRR